MRKDGAPNRVQRAEKSCSAALVDKIAASTVNAA